jgi:LuxR family maltose regulon positive regulatory protein
MAERGRTPSWGARNNGSNGTRRVGTEARSAIVRRSASGDERLPRLFSESQWARLSVHFGLTVRQADIARLICQAHTYESMAARTGTSINTVRMHIRDLFEKLDAHDRVSVVVRLVAAERTLSAGGQGKPG